MTAHDLLHLIQVDGAELTLTAGGRLRITGAHAERHLPIIRQYEAQLIQALRATAEQIPGRAARGIH